MDSPQMDDLPNLDWRFTKLLMLKVLNCLQGLISKSCFEILTAPTFWHTVWFTENIQWHLCALIKKIWSTCDIVLLRPKTDLYRILILLKRKLSTLICGSATTKHKEVHREVLLQHSKLLFMCIRNSRIVYSRLNTPLGVANKSPRSDGLLKLRRLVFNG